MIYAINQLIQRDLDKLKEEVQAFEPSQLWVVQGDIRNSAGNLTLHICGNLQHFIGHILGNLEYVRDREFEFEGSGLTAKELVAEVEKAQKAVKNTLNHLDNEHLHDPYPIEVFGYGMNVGHFLIHLHGHLNYHLGQVNYLRRLI